MEQYNKKIHKFSFDFNSSIFSMLPLKKMIGSKSKIGKNYQIEVNINFINKPLHDDLINKTDYKICWSYLKSSLGNIFSAFLDERLVIFAICSDDTIDDYFREIKKNWPSIYLTEDNEKVEKIWYDSINKHKVIKITAFGTVFQTTVWKKLLTISSGETRSYLDIAKSLRIEKSVRAVGTAVGKNPLFYLIPCHRVVRSSGEIGGYRWGLDLKKQILHNEICLKNSLNK